MVHVCLQTFIRSSGMSAAHFTSCCSGVSPITTDEPKLSVSYILLLLKTCTGTYLELFTFLDYKCNVKFVSVGYSTRGRGFYSMLLLSIIGPMNTQTIVTQL